MSRVWTFFLSGFVACLFSSVKAQDATPLPAPSPPFVNKAPVNSAWIVKFSSAKGAQTSSNASPAQVPMPLIREIDVTKNKDLRHVETSLSIGKKSDAWYMGVYELIEQTGVSDIIILTTYHAFGSRSLVQSFDESDFPELNWINLQAYVGETTFQSKKCYHFKGPEVVLGSVIPLPANTKILNPPPPPATLEAWIDPETKLPLAATDQKGFLMIYSFKQGPSEPLVLPEKFVKALDAYKSKVRR